MVHRRKSSQVANTMVALVGWVAHWQTVGLTTNLLDARECVWTSNLLLLVLLLVICYRLIPTIASVVHLSGLLPELISRVSLVPAHKALMIIANKTTQRVKTKRRLERIWEEENELYLAREVAIVVSVIWRQCVSGLSVILNLVISNLMVTNLVVTW